MPTKDYRIMVTTNAVHKMNKWAYQLSLIKDDATKKGNYRVSTDCATALRGLNGVISFYQGCLDKLEEELAMADISVQPEKPTCHLRLVKK